MGPDEGFVGCPEERQILAAVPAAFGDQLLDRAGVICAAALAERDGAILAAERASAIAGDALHRAVRVLLLQLFCDHVLQRGDGRLRLGADGGWGADGRLRLW